MFFLRLSFSSLPSFSSLFVSLPLVLFLRAAGNYISGNRRIRSRDGSFTDRADARPCTLARIRPARVRLAENFDESALPSDREAVVRHSLSRPRERTARSSRLVSVSFSASGGPRKWQRWPADHHARISTFTLLGRPGINPRKSSSFPKTLRVAEQSSIFPTRVSSYPLMSNSHA